MTYDDDDAIRRHPLQIAMIDAIRAQIDAIGRVEKLNNLLLPGLTVKQLRDVMLFVDSFDPADFQE